MFEFLFGYLLGSSARRASSGPSARLTFGTLMALTRGVATLATGMLVILLLGPLLLGPLLLDTFPDVFVPGWTWKARAAAVAGLMIANLVVHAICRRTARAE